MGSVFLYVVSAAFAVGLLLRSFLTVGFFDAAFMVLIALALPIMVSFANRKVSRWTLVLTVGLVACACGILRIDYEETKVSAFTVYEGATVSLTGIVVCEPDVRDRTVHLYIDPLELGDELVLVTTDRFVSVAYGDRVMVEGVLTKPEAFETDLGRTFDYEGYLRARGVQYMLPFANVSVVGSGEGNSIVGALLTAKAAFMESLEQSLPEPHAGLGEGLLLGVKRALGPELEDVFRTTGIIHIVVLSGYNLMIVATCIMWLLSFVALPRTRLMVGIGVIVLFTLMVGLSASVVRASIMAILVLIAQATGRTYAILRALVLAGVSMLLLNPYLLAFDPGFQLSFLATLGLIFLAPHIEERLHRVPNAVFSAREFLTATLATQIMVLPLLLYLMGQLSLVAVVVNVLVLPMVPIAMLLTFCAGIAGLLLPAFGTIVGLSAYVSLGYIIGIPEFFARLPFAAFSVPAFPFWVTILMYLVLAYSIFRFMRRVDTKTNLVAHREVGVVDSALTGWTIEEEIQKSPEVQSPSGDRPTKLPFR